MHGNISRELEKRLEQRFSQMPVIAILGSRQCGKSTLASMFLEGRSNYTVLDLERPEDLLKLEDPESFFIQNKEKIICIDEIQRKPELFPVIRYVSDKHKRSGQFLILGSASKELIRQSSESLAGRISYLELTPFLWAEVNQVTKQLDYISRGGFPRSLLADNDQSSFDWRRDFLTTFFERDLPAINNRLSPQLMSRLFQMLSHIHGQILNVNTLANSLGADNKTVSNYIDILEGSFLVRRLQPYYANLKKRLIKSPKIYIRDTGVLNYILRLPDVNSIMGHPVFGKSWESVCIENIVARIKPEVQISYYRTSNGAEIDLLLENGEEKIAVEFKSSRAPRAEKGFWFSIEDLNITRAWLVAPVDETYKNKQLTVSSLEFFINSEENKDFII